MSINDSVVHFKNQLNKSDKEAFTQWTYSIRLKTNGYHFECMDKPGYLYAVDNLKLTDISGSQIQIKASYRFLELRRKRKNDFS